MHCYEVLISAGKAARLISREVCTDSVPKAINLAMERVAFDWPTLTPIRPVCIDTQAGGAFRWDEPMPRPEWEPIHGFCVECLSPAFKEKLAEFHVWATCADEAVSYVKANVGIGGIEIKAEECNETDMGNLAQPGGA